MHASLQENHRLYYNEAVKFSDLLSKFSSAQLNIKPNSGSWSALEVFDHLIHTERLILQSIQKRTARPDPLRPVDFNMHYRSFVLMLAMILPLKFNAPTQAIRPEQSSLNEDDLRIQWKNLHDDWEVYLNQFEEKYLHVMIFKHPRAGYLSMKHTLKFMRLHLRHHQFQLKRIYAIVSGLE